MCHYATEERTPHTVQETAPPKPRRLPRRAVIAFVMAVLSLFGMRQAAADSNSGNQDPDYLVSAALTSSGRDAATAAPGDTVTADFSVMNQSTAFKKVRVQLRVASPTGVTLAGSMDLPMAPQQAQAQKFSFKVPDSLPAGTYNWTLEAEDATGVTPTPQPAAFTTMLGAGSGSTEGARTRPEPVEPGPVMPGQPVPRPIPLPVTPPNPKVSMAMVSITIT